ncbi:MAG: tripartite tricarboxylate transporter TctB family protein [Desulfobacterales bacterium]
MRGWADRIFGLAMLGVAGLWIHLALKLPFPAFAKSARVGPGHFPAGIAILLAVPSLILIARTWTPKSRGGAADPAGMPEPTGTPAGIGGRRNLLIGFGLFTAYIAASPIAGFIPASLAFILAMTRITGNIPWLKSALAALITTGLLWAIFVLWLQIPLPAGAWRP